MVQPASLKAWKNVNTDQKCWIREENSVQALDLDQFPDAAHRDPDPSKIGYLGTLSLSVSWD